jgi:CheY-like chemotaxis protein
VIDHGEGMSEDVRKRAFEPFFTTKEPGAGSGLGLSMVFGFAEQSGGEAVIHSEEGAGTTVKLYLPRAKIDVSKQPKPQAEAVPRGRGETILVIEDDPEVRNLAEMMLGNLGYKVVSAADASIARQTVESSHEISLILSDVILPGGTSGPEFADELRTSHPEMKVLFMSGYPAEAAKRNGFFGPDNGLLNKPFRIAQLAKAVKAALD